MTTVKKQPTAAQALQRLQTMCAKAEHCRWELKRKLRLWNIGADDAEAIMDSLTKTRFVDDTRFAKAFARDKFIFSSWGRRKIEAALRQRQIDAVTIAAAMEQIDPDEYEAAARRLIERHAGTMADADSYDGRTRLFRFAAARGFEPELVARIIRSGR